MKKVLMILVLLVSFNTFTSFSQSSPIQVSLFNPIQIFPESTAIQGVRLNILYGKNVSVEGLDLGLVNHTGSGKSVGLQFGILGLADADFLGWQDNWVNITKGSFTGLQVGAFNYSGRMKGLQLAVVNYAVSVKGVQIGLINIIEKGGFLPFFPIFNFGK